jgi:hypothetical protein
MSTGYNCCNTKHTEGNKEWSYVSRIYNYTTMNSYRPASITSNSTSSMITISDSIIDVRPESTEVDEREIHTSEDRAIDQVEQDYVFE